MSFIFVAGLVAVIAFLLCMVRPGRFGMTVLALGAGYLLATLWTDSLAASQLVQLPFVSWRDAVFMGLILLPGVVALILGPRQKSLVPRIVAALAVALLAVTLILPLFKAGPESGAVYHFISQYRDVIVSSLLVFGLLDAVFSRLPKAPKPSKD